MHPLRRRLLAEELVRLRPADDHARYAAVQRRARIDPNPHQIDAVMFALARLSEGGCILADEVGLGKTIEAGLVIAQRLSEGARRVLVVLPKSLVGQWQAELFDHFGVQARELGDSAEAPGVYLVGREQAGGARGAAVLGSAPPFDLVVIDEAHELFSGIHRRYGRDGAHDEASTEALTAHRVRGVLAGAPVLLLTATPIQNSLAELWGLVQYVEPTGTLLGDLATFRDVFTGDDDRRLTPGQAHELQRRVATVCRRTLRRQAAEFLDRPFVARRGRLVELEMSAEERALYDDVTEFLLQPSLAAFSGRQRRLLLLGFHRRMASSLAALAASLDAVEARLVALTSGEAPPSDPHDLDDDDPVESREEPASPLRAAEAELAEVRAFAARARALPRDAKARAFLDVIAEVRARGRDGQGSGKAVVFTESLTTQRFLRELLLSEGLRDDEITLFRGDNEHPRAHAALARYEAEHPRRGGPRPTREAALRLALVHEHATRSAVLISTEAGAKGLNLQFCETVINYDLPWNPQRIEQRIGRCHRYGQRRPVTVVSFLAKGNDAERLTWDILSRKLELFGDVLGASDEVLVKASEEAPTGAGSALSLDVERELADAYDRASSKAELVAALAAAADRLQARRDAFLREQARTAALIESRLSTDVQRVFRGLRDELPARLARFDRDVADLVEAHLGDSTEVARESRDGRIVLSTPRGLRLVAGAAEPADDAEPLHLEHPAVRAAVEGARRYQGGVVRLRGSVGLSPGARGGLAIARVTYRGFEPHERLVVAAIVDGAPLSAERARALLDGEISDAAQSVELDRSLLSLALEQAVFLDQSSVEEQESRRLDAALVRLERYADDRAIVARRQLTRVEARLRSATARLAVQVGVSDRARVDREVSELGATRDALVARIDELVSRRDPEHARWRDHYRALRFEPPTVARLLDVAFVVEAPC